MNVSRYFRKPIDGGRCLHCASLMVRIVELHAFGHNLRRSIGGENRRRSSGPGTRYLIFVRNFIAYGVHAYKYTYVFYIYAPNWRRTPSTVTIPFRSRYRKLYYITTSARSRFVSRTVRVVFGSSLPNVSYRSLRYARRKTCNPFDVSKTLVSVTNPFSCSQRNALGPSRFTFRVANLPITCNGTLRRRNCRLFIPRARVSRPDINVSRR